MKIGLFYLFSDFGNAPQDQIFNEVLDEIEYGQELGFDSIWLPEHHFAVYGMLGNPPTLAAAIAQRTKRMRIGTAVIVLPYQHPYGWPRTRPSSTPSAVDGCFWASGAAT